MKNWLGSAQTQDPTGFDPRRPLVIPETVEIVCSKKRALAFALPPFLRSGEYGCQEA